MPTGKKKISKKQKVKSMAEKIQMNFAVLGSSHCGKTSLVKRFLSGSFSDTYKPTLMDVFEECYRLDAINIDVSYRIFDIAGSDDFPAMRQLAINSAEKFLIVYAVNDRNSFEDVKKVLQDITKVKGRSGLSILVVANKCDAAHHAVDSDEGRALAKKWGCDFAETSAKHSRNIDILFTEPVIRTLKHKYPELATVSQCRLSPTLTQ